MDKCYGEHQATVESADDDVYVGKIETGVGASQISLGDQAEEKENASKAIRSIGFSRCANIVHNIRVPVAH